MCFSQNECVYFYRCRPVFLCVPSVFYILMSVFLFLTSAFIFFGVCISMFDFLVFFAHSGYSVFGIDSRGFDGMFVGGIRLMGRTGPF